MNTLVSIWLQFAGCVAIIGVAGTRLARHGDTIAALTGLSRNWVGLVLVATVTSAPELVTGLSSVTLALAPDIALGDVLGSCVFNLAILAVIDVGYRKGVVYALAARSHIVTAAFGAVMLAGVALILVLSGHGAMPSFGHASAASPILVALYLIAMRSVYLTERRRAVAMAPAAREAGSLRRALMGYGAASVFIIAAGIWLPLVGVELAQAMGWSNSLVGTLFVALATSVPEIATTWGAMRVGAIDMAVGNLLGSNLFDVLILALDDLAYLRGPLFAHASAVHVVSAVAACLMSGIVIVALALRPTSRVWRTASWASIVLVCLYLVNAVVQYADGR